mmetsp:Transcript_10698/g.17944  ORF Transcript_10698/g.17944 Transcript_10698/m.17944 type:complete len:148 (-) Transcript_10698:67-510(-)
MLTITRRSARMYSTIVTTRTGLKWKDIVEPPADAPAPERGDTVQVHYEGRLEDGTMFDSSYSRGAPLAFRVGRGDVIKGWDEGVASMRKGGKRQLIIPSHLGYGPRSVGPIPPNSLLHFDVELVSIQKAGSMFERLATFLKAVPFLK